MSSDNGHTNPTREATDGESVQTVPPSRPDTGYTTDVVMDEHLSDTDEERVAQFIMELPSPVQDPLSDAIEYFHSQINERFPFERERKRFLAAVEEFVDDCGWPTIEEFQKSRQQRNISHHNHETGIFANYSVSPPADVFEPSTDSGAFPPLTAREYFGDATLALIDASDAVGEYPDQERTRCIGNVALVPESELRPEDDVHPAWRPTDSQSASSISTNDNATEAEAPPAPRYNVEGRGWSDQTIRDKRLGWAPQDEEALFQHLWEKGYTREQMLATGLFIGFNTPDDTDEYDYDVTDPQASDLPTEADESEYPTIETWPAPSEPNTDVFNLAPAFQGRFIFPYFTPTDQAGVGRPDPDSSGQEHRNAITATGQSAPRYVIGRKPSHPGWEPGSMDNGPKYKKAVKTQPYSWANEPMYGVETIRPGEPLVITEGMPDAISAHDKGIPALSPVTTQFKDEHAELLDEILRAFKISQVYIAQDNDPATPTVDTASEEGDGKFTGPHGRWGRVESQTEIGADDTDDTTLHDFDAVPTDATLSEVEELTTRIQKEFATRPFGTSTEPTASERATDPPRFPDPGEKESLLDTPGRQVTDTTGNRPTFTKHAAGPISYFLSINEYGPGEEGAVNIAKQLDETDRAGLAHILLPPRFGPEGADFDDYLQAGWLKLCPPMAWVQWAARAIASYNGPIPQGVENGHVSWIVELLVEQEMRMDPLYGRVGDHARSYTVRSTQSYPIISDSKAYADNYDDWKDPAEGDPGVWYGEQDTTSTGADDSEQPHFTGLTTDPPHAPFPDTLGGEARHPETVDAVTDESTTTPLGMFGGIPALRPKYHPAYQEAAGPGYRPPAASDDDDRDTSGSVSRLSGNGQNEIFHIDYRDVYPSHLHDGFRGKNPLGHRGESENYFVVQKKGGALTNYDHKRKTHYTPQEYMLVKGGFRDIESPKRPEMSGHEQYALWLKLRMDGIVSEACSIPVKGLNYFAIKHDLVEPDELVEVQATHTASGEGPDRTFKGLPEETYNTAIDLMRDHDEMPDPALAKKGGDGDGGDRDSIYDHVIDGVEGLNKQQAMRVFAEEFIEEATDERLEATGEEWEDYKVKKDRLRTMWDVWSSFHGFEESLKDSNFMQNWNFRGVIAVDPTSPKLSLEKSEGDTRDYAYGGIRLSERGEELDSAVDKTE